MTGTILPPPAAAAVASTLAGVGPGVGGSSNQLTPSAFNSFRISIVAERLASHVEPGNRGDAVDFFNLCLSLSRGIDYAVANNETPGKAQELPILFKQICQRKNDAWLKAAIMVLMMSVKNACQIGWFQQKDTEELLAIADEIGKSYCSMGNVHEGISYCASMIPTIMERFFPRMELGQVLASIQVKPGYGAYTADIHISKTTAHSPQDKIWLLVAQTDNIETSACIISPQQVSFLLNGKGVERRTNVFMDPGPQMPTSVTGMLKYGTNLLQAVGQFNGNYIILVAFMSVKSLPENPVHQKYVQPPLMPVDSDSDIIEESSRISLNCPISFKRIKTPVKGHLCKHLQCFDFDNFVNINSRRPAWRCPHCNQPVCYPDIRIDQNMVEVLKDIGENVVEVIIRADGSWKAVLENDDNVDKTQNKAYNSEKEQTEAQESTSSLRTNCDFLDLTNDDDQMEIMNSFEIEDRKPLQADLQFHSVPSNSTSLGMDAAGTNENAAAPLEDDFWSGLYFSQGRLETPAIGTSSEFPVLTDAISATFNRQAEGLGNTLAPNSVMQNQFSAQNNLQLQQFDHLNSVGNEYGRSLAITASRHFNRTPVAIQALPAQPQGLGPHQRSRINMNSPITGSAPISPHVSLSSPATADGLNAILSDAERQQRFSRPLINLPQVPGMTSSAQQHHSATEIRGPNNVDSSARSQLSNPFQPSQFLTALQNPHLQQALYPRASRPAGQSPGTMRPLNLPRSHIQQGGLQGGIAQAAGATGNSQRARVAPSIQVPSQTSKTTPYAADNFRGSAGEQRGNVGGTAESIPRPDGSLNLQSEQNWRPTGRMRGSLSGRQYSDTVRQLIIEPSQSGQNVRPQNPRPPQSVPNVGPQVPPMNLPNVPNVGPQAPPTNLPNVPSVRPQAPPTRLRNIVLPRLQPLLANRNAHSHPETHNSPSG